MIVSKIPENLGAKPAEVPLNQPPTGLVVAQDANQVATNLPLVSCSVVVIGVYALQLECSGS